MTMFSIICSGSRCSKLLYVASSHRVLPSLSLCILKRYIAYQAETIHMQSIEQNQEYIQVRWNDETSCKFPQIYLRDNCQCPVCFHASSQQRQLDLVRTVDVNIRATDIHHDVDHDVLSIKWPDKHESMFKGDWLKERILPESMRKAKSITLDGIESIPWSACTMKDNLPSVDYEQFKKAEEALLKFLENLFIHGLSFLKNAPAEPGVLHGLPWRASLGYVKKSHYGDVFTVKSKPSPSSLAYTARALPLHVDLPCYQYQAGFQCLHCIEQSEGEDAGTSIFADGFNAAAKLKMSQPDFFDKLTKINFQFKDVGADEFGAFDMQCERPIIGLDSFGAVEAISLANHIRGAFINAPHEDVMDVYRAYYALSNFIYQDVLEYKMSPGDIVCFNNKRILHGRKSYDATTTTRWLEGIYMDADEVKSKYPTTRKNISYSVEC